MFFSTKFFAALLASIFFASAIAMDNNTSSLFDDIRKDVAEGATLRAACEASAPEGVDTKKLNINVKGEDIVCTVGGKTWSVGDSAATSTPIAAPEAAPRAVSQNESNYGKVDCRASAPKGVDTKIVFINQTSGMCC